jgi:hypothetical protein
MRVLVAKLLLCAGAVLALAAAPALTKPVGACNAHRAHATRVTPKVIVYPKRLPGYDGYGGVETVYYACARPAGKPIEVGISDTSGGEYPADYAISSLQIGGAYVGAALASGYADASACSKYGGTDCGGSVHVSVRVVDARARRWLQAPIPGAATLAVSPAGALAWVQPTSSPGISQLEAIVLRRGAPGRLAGAPQLLDTGAIAPSLRFSGLTLSWTNSGQAKRRQLR